MSVDEEAMLPGERLRRAREEQGLNQEEVSKQLRLSLSYLKALENDDYARLPEPTFIKGYLRNYARFLGLPAEELARRFQQEMDEQRSAEHEREQLALEDTPRRQEWRLPMLVILVVVLVVALGWWLWPRHEGPAASPEAPARSPSSQEQGAPASPEPSLPQDTDPVEPADDTLAPSAPQPPSEQGTGDAAVPADGLDGGTPTGVPARPRPDAGVDDTALADADPDTAPAEPVEAGVDRISLTFSRVCWVRVEDASGATLSQGQRQAGDSLDLEGEAPFRLTVGDAAAVSSVTLNGDAVSLPSQRSGDVVRVTLP